MKIIYRIHALKRMFERNISINETKHVLANHEILESYSNDQPYPSKLVLGFIGKRPIHIVYGENIDDNEIIVITAYEPDDQKWTDNFKRRI